jgi:ferrochelatase
MSVRYDALLVVSFGGPSGPGEVMPFLERVTRGRGVPRERLEAVATHYHHFGGTSPIHARTAELVDALREALAPLPVYLANRYSPPELEDVLRAMQADGVRRALALATSAFSSYSGCRAYLDDIARARAAIEERSEVTVGRHLLPFAGVGMPSRSGATHVIGEGAPEIHKIRPFSAHPGYVETCARRLAEALATVGDRPAHVLFSAHSIPLAMAAACAYEAELSTLAERVAAILDLPRARLVYQSRSGPPQVPWLEPDVLDALRAIAAEDPGATVVIAPFGFVADHMEVVWDLDVEARQEAERLGLTLVRAEAANAHPRFVAMVRELVEEAMARDRPDECAAGCCPPPRRP